MSGVLHPMGPEPAQTYWVRRGVLLAVVLLLAAMVVFGVANLTKAAVATAPPPPIPPAVTSPTPSTTPRPSTAVSTPPAGPAPSATSGGPSSSAPPSTSAVPSSSTAAKASATPSAEPGPTTTVIGTPDCAPAGLRVKVSGDRSLSPGQNNTFTLSLVNAGARTCLTSVTDTNFELKIYSGKDRIWSSQDCGKTLAAFDKKLAPRAGVSWKMTWNGERSVKSKDCKRGADTPQAGTYWATAQLDGAKPVQLRMIIS
ncbi:MAG TPA: hypothetical protein VFR88_12340 [Microlunatus sp.]|nr:hypothetical protein [Microlunatus sp.]